MRPRVTSVGLILPPPPPENFDFPAHIDGASLAALPARPGVYFFRNQRGDAIYIGKSVNIRSRVQAHLRAAEEMTMLAATRRVDFMQTAGEIGALLLESQLIKRHQPAFNVLLKFSGASFTLYLPQDSHRLRVVDADECDACQADGLYGLFASRSDAEQALHALVRREQLCPAMLGLESTTHGRACFAHQIGRCRGACIGRETGQAHAQRLRLALTALQAAVWPHGGPIGIIEQEGKWRQVHVIDCWSYIGSLPGRRSRIALPARHGIDIDTYKILAKPLAEGRLAYVTCAVTQSRAGRFATIPARISDLAALPSPQ
ncbi:GIY-YIG nuclease family protein [Janthinobacterium sp. 17J80-10]|uniref:GIY-YIG nuclease family protein n=1 Tax=Janthinobacterium sp. 17J80-10 TaxID=2497863 RepID=UPI0010057F9C|nr:GIY-YIG nuclease family protein [Janthinobacterium sp. 17J80-10]QAU33700.1 endonuclease [Janthinobacterium sp. 17J80-10]